MKFCKECESMLYPSEEDYKLLEICKKCGYNQDCNDTIINSKNYKKKKFTKKQE